MHLSCDTYGAGWKALLCRRCGTDFKKARGTAPATAAHEHGARRPISDGLRAGVDGEPGVGRVGGGERGGGVGVRGKKMMDVFGDTLLLLNRRCHRCHLCS